MERVSLQRSASPAAGLSPRLRLCFVDLCLADPARYYCGADLKRSTDSQMLLGDNYRAWLTSRQPLPISSSLRMALVSKVLDALSQFSVCSFRTNVLP